MRTLPSNIATTVLVAICDGKVHMIFSWSSKGTHIAPLENTDVQVSMYLNIMDWTYIMGTYRAPCDSYMRLYTTTFTS